MNDIKFINMSERDIYEALNIYNFYIINSTATFYYNNISIDEFKSVISINKTNSISKAIYYKNELIGFCFITQYRNKDAYRRTAEIGIYFKDNYTKMGFGKRAVSYLEKAAMKIGYKVIIASIAGENSNSIRLFEKLGYVKCAHYKAIAEKFNGLQDIIDLQKNI